MNVWNISDKKRIAIVKLVRQMMGLHIREFCQSGVKCKCT